MRVLLRLGGFAAASGFALIAGDPFIGEWTLNVAKSVFDPNEPALRSATRSYERSGKRSRIVWDIENADGRRSHGEYTAKCDAKVYLSGASEGISCKQVNSRSVEGIVLTSGRIVRRYEQTVSKDGQTMTLRFFAPDNAKTPTSVLVYERR